MGPLWAWVILWLVSAYGLVLLLRRTAIQAVEEPVPVLVATPKPVEPAPPEESLEAPGEAPPADEGELTVSIPAMEAEAIANPLDRSDEPLAPAIQAIEADLEFAADQGQEEPDAALATPETLLETDVLGPSAAFAGSEEGGGIESEPWIKEREETEASEPWIKEKEERTPDAPWIQEREGHEASDPWRPEDELANSVATAAVQEEEEDDAVYRSIDLEALTLGLEASEIQALYGSPGHLSKLGEDGEQWRYPLNATDERGAGVHGVLVLEFQRGRLVRKSLEEGQEA